MMDNTIPSPKQHQWSRFGLILIAAFSLIITGCGDDNGTDNGTTDNSGNGETSGIQIDGAWARTSPMNAANGAAYMDITNNGDVDDALVGAAISTDIADRAELHETRAVETDDAMTPQDTSEGMEGSDGMMPQGAMEDMMGDNDSAPMMEMVEVDRIPLPAGVTVSLEPGGLHIMIMELVNGLEEGSEIELTLSFETAEDIVVTAVVGDGAM